MMELPPGMAMQVTKVTRCRVQQLHKVVQERVENLVRANQQLAGGIPSGPKPLHRARNRNAGGPAHKGKDSWKASKPTTPRQAQDFKYDVADIKGYKATFTRLKEMEGLQTFCGRWRSSPNISPRRGRIAEGQPWVADNRSAPNCWRRFASLRSVNRGVQIRSPEAVEKTQVAISRYISIFTQSPLSIARTRRKRTCPGLPPKTPSGACDRQFHQFSPTHRIERQLDKLKTGTLSRKRTWTTIPSLTTAFAKHGRYKCFRTDAPRQFETSVDQIHKSWTKSLLNDLADPVIQSHLNCSKRPEKDVRDFMQAKERRTKSR